MPPAPTGRAYISPLVDMFNNPATVPKTSSERLNSTGECHFVANYKSKWHVTVLKIIFGFLGYYHAVNSRTYGGVENVPYEIFIYELPNRQNIRHKKGRTVSSKIQVKILFY